MCGAWTDRRIDGCVDDLPGRACMGVLLGDQNDGTGFFTLMAAIESSAGEF